MYGLMCEIIHNHVDSIDMPANTGGAQTREDSYRNYADKNNVVC